jgi:hypothetical protein
MSAMEHLVPEMMFSTEENPAHGISAVKALQLAAAEGQKIWTITQTNLNTALAAINLPSDIKTDIRNSVNAGMEVTTHEAAVDFYGSNQVGYIVIDPETGAGGYLIGGGENGGNIDTSFFDAMTWVTLMVGLADTFKSILLASSGPVGIVSAYLNILSSVVAFGLACGNSAASAAILFISTVMAILAFMLANPAFGVAGFLVSIGIAIMMHAAGLYISSVLARGCRG